MNAIMKFQPTYVFMISLSRRFLRNWTCGASADPKVAVAMKQLGPVLDEVVELEVEVVEVEVVEL